VAFAQVTEAADTRPGGASGARSSPCARFQADLAALHERAAAPGQNAKSDNTLRAYRNDWTRFERWCETHQLPSLPASAETVRAYLTDASERPSLFRRRGR
jgi:hypothetical protein